MAAPKGLRWLSPRVALAVALALPQVVLAQAAGPSLPFNAQWQTANQAGHKADAKALIHEALKAMGGEGLTTLRYSGTGTAVLVGQSFEPGKPAPHIKVLAFNVLLDLAHGGLREDLVRTRLEASGGGTLPPLGAGEQRSTTYLLGTEAWNMLGPIPVPATYAAAGRFQALWTTPHGVLLAALRNDVVAATRASGAGKTTTLSFTEPGRFSAQVTLNASGLVQQVDARVANAWLGDTAIVTRFSGYKAFAGGVKFPTYIAQTQGGNKVLDWQVAEVLPNASPAIEQPAMVRGAVDRVVTELLAPGVWLLAGGAHHSVAIALKDQVVLVESPLSEARAQAVIAEVKRLAPGKPIRFVIATHHHADSLGGVRAVLAEGATLLISDAAKPYADKVLANANSIDMDALELSGNKPVVIGIKTRHTLTDGERSVEVHEVTGSTHAKGLLMVYLPAERLLVETDAYTPGASGGAANLLANIERLKLDVQRIVPLHGRVVTLSELAVAAGGASPPQALQNR